MPIHSCTILVFTFNGSLAGSETTAAALTFLLYHILANRKHWERLSTELRTKFRSADEMTNSSLALMPFLDAVIREGKLHLRTFSNLISTPTSTSDPCEPPASRSRWRNDD